MKSPFPYNYHSHSQYCDGAHLLEDYIMACLDRGYLSYGFSSHAPIPGGSVWNMKEENLDTYILEINKLKKKYLNLIEIYSSLEVDYIDQIQGPGKYANLLDYTIGSVHFIGKGNMEDLFEMDGPYSKFLNGLEKHYDHNIRAAVAHFFELNLKMIQEDPPDIIGHIDKIITHASRYEEGIHETKWYLEILHGLAEELAKTDIIIEINTKGLQSGFKPSTYPNIKFLEILKGYPIRFQMNGDVHKISHIDLGYQETLSQIKAIGITELWVREKNQWKEKRI